MASPYQVKFCYSLQKYFDAEFWFYQYIDKTRPEWWKIPLGEKCKIMKASSQLPNGSYFSLGLFIEMLRFKPDFVILGGFGKWHIIVSKFAKIIGAKVAIMSEPLRYVDDDDQATTKLLNRENSKSKLNSLRKSYKNVDLYIAMGETAEKQFIEEIQLPKEKVINLSYPQDIEKYYEHSLRAKKIGDPITLLFANRLVERYQPIMALEVLKRLSLKYPNVKMLMNSEGAEKQACIDFINKNKMTNVQFLNKIDSWNNMHLIYENSDVLILPCVYSNGNGTIVEARASGMGIVISNQINNIEKHSVHNENCFICELNVEDFTNAVSKYIDNPEILISHGKLSRELVKYRRNDATAKTYFDALSQNGIV